MVLGFLSTFSNTKQAFSKVWLWWDTVEQLFDWCLPVVSKGLCLGCGVIGRERRNGFKDQWLVSENVWPLLCFLQQGLTIPTEEFITHTWTRNAFKTELRAWLLSLNDTRFRQMPVLCLLMSLQWKNTEHSRHVLKALFWQFYALRAACLNLEGCFTALKIYTFLFHWIMSRLLKPSPLGKQTAQTEI